MTVDAAFRRQVLQVVVQVFSDFTEFRYTSDVKAKEQPGELEFTYLPEGMERVETELDERDYFVWYEDCDGRFITLDQSLVEGNDELIWMLDTEDAEVTEFKVHNYDAIGIQKGADCTIHWTDDQMVYVLLGRNLPMEELEKVAEGIQIDE